MIDDAMDDERIIVSGTEVLPKCWACGTPHRTRKGLADCINSHGVIQSPARPK